MACVSGSTHLGIVVRGGHNHLIENSFEQKLVNPKFGSKKL